MVNNITGPFLIPGDPPRGIELIPPYIEPTPKPDEPEEDNNITVPCKTQETSVLPS